MNPGKLWYLTANRNPVAAGSKKVPDDVTHFARECIDKTWRPIAELLSKQPEKAESS